MSTVAICTDSSALFPAGVADRLGVTVVPIQMTLDGEPFDERVHTIDDFYALLAGGAEVMTSQPSPGDFLEAYAAAAADGAEEVLSIHLDARVSGTTGSAELAAYEAPIAVTVVDTGTVSFGVGACVKVAAEALEAGAASSDAVAVAQRLGSSLRNVFVAPGAGDGRVGPVKAWTVLELADGRTQPLAESDTVDEAIALMASRVVDAKVPVRAAVGHAGAAVETSADALALSLASLSGVLDVERYRVGPAVGAHTGPLSFGAFWWPRF